MSEKQAETPSAPREKLEGKLQQPRIPKHVADNHPAQIKSADMVRRLDPRPMWPCG